MATGISDFRRNGMMVQRRSSDGNHQRNVKAYHNVPESKVEEGLRRESKKATEEIAEIGVEIDTLARQVGAIEMRVNWGEKADERVVMNLIELLMNQLIKLDAVEAQGDAKSQRRFQVKRVQKYLETLDVLKTRTYISPR